MLLKQFDLDSTNGVDTVCTIVIHRKANEFKPLQL